MMRNTHRSRGGFTLVEIMVVLAIAALLSAIVLSGFSSLRQNNRRTTCQTNLVQIYQAVRQYSQDYNGQLPYYNTNTKINDSNDVGGIGLWALYAYPSDADGTVLTQEDLTDSSAKFRTGYLKSASALHCPNDDFTRNGHATQALYATQTATANTLNPDYLSYQVNDGTVPTYQTFRTVGNKNQLKYYTGTAPTANTPSRPPSDKTVITWCRFHRRLDNNGDTIVNAGNKDIVLFYDGSVQTLPVQEETTTGNGLYCDTIGANCVTGWERQPKVN